MQTIDIEIAVLLLRNNKIHPSVRMLVVPASRAIAVEAARRGYLEILMELEPRSCPAAAPFAPALIKEFSQTEKSVCQHRTQRPGRMGNAKAEIFLCSPATAVASAIAGEICDPRRFL